MALSNLLMREILFNLFLDMKKIATFNWSKCFIFNKLENDFDTHHTGLSSQTA